MKRRFTVVVIMLILLIFATSNSCNADDIQNSPEYNADLSELHLQYGGISPSFDKDITEYYFIASNEIDSIDIIAVPENSASTVNIIGNKNIQYGKNTIVIQVTSQNGVQTKVYNINVTKTNTVETANANLETLAVRQGMLTPEFDNNTTKYTVDISNDIYNIDILAIPQRENATVTIIGNNEMQIGDNQIQVLVRAEDDITEKIYEITVHRRTSEEQLQNEENTKMQAERLSLILNGDEANRQVQNLNGGNDVAPIIAGIVLIGIVAGGIYFGSKRNKK